MKIKMKLSICFASIIVIVLLSSPAKSSVVYSGKLNIEGPNFNIDINNDGQDDFITKWRMWAGGNGNSTNAFDAKMNLGIRFVNTELGGMHAGHGFPGTKAPLDYGTLIGFTPRQDLLWSYNSNDAMMWTKYDMWNTPSITYSGVWHNVSNKYIGFELTDNSNLYYGWLQIETDNLNNIILVDYAYEDVADTPIAAGAFSVPLPSTFFLLLSGVSTIIFRKMGSNLRLTLVANSGFKGA